MLKVKNILSVAAALSLCVLADGRRICCNSVSDQRLLDIPLHCNKHHKSSWILQNDFVNV